MEKNDLIAPVPLLNQWAVFLLFFFLKKSFASKLVEPFNGSPMFKFMYFYVF